MASLQEAHHPQKPLSGGKAIAHNLCALCGIGFQNRMRCVSGNIGRGDTVGGDAKALQFVRFQRILQR